MVVVSPIPASNVRLLAVAIELVSYDVIVENAEDVKTSVVAQMAPMYHWV